MFFSSTKRDPRITWLRDLAPFRALGDESIQEIAAASYRTGRAAGTKLIRQGSYGHEAFVIAQGAVDIVRDGELVARLGRGDLLGEMSMVHDPHRTADAWVSQDVELAVWDRSAFLDVLRFVPPVDQLVRTTASARAA